MRKATLSVWEELWGLPAVWKQDVSFKGFSLFFFKKTFLLDTDKPARQAISRNQDNIL